MRKLITTTVVLLLSLTTPLAAATPTEFYLGLLRRGTTDVMAGEYRRGASVLRLAAFGLVESVEHYELAQIHLAIASDRLQDETGTRDAARRVLTAELVERRYASLSLTPATRGAFETIAKKVLGPGEVELLFSPPPRAATTTAGNASISNPPAAAAPPAMTAAAGPAPRPSQQVDSEPAPSLPPVVSTKPADVETLLSKARIALEADDLAEARALYQSALAQPAITRAAVIIAAEGLYRARDFKGSLAAFARAGALQPGEEPYHYYLAVALYETGDYARAKTELAAALPHIEISPAISTYVDKIGAARP